MSLPVPARIPSASVSSVASSATVVTLAAANEFRTQLTIFNDSTAALYVKLGSAGSTSSFSIKMGAGSYFELAGGSTVYTGVVTGLWDAVNGACLVTEY